MCSRLGLGMIPAAALGQMPAWLEGWVTEFLGDWVTTLLWSPCQEGHPRSSQQPSTILLVKKSSLCSFTTS